MRTQLLSLMLMVFLTLGCDSNPAATSTSDEGGEAAVDAGAEPSNPNDASDDLSDTEGAADDTQEGEENALPDEDAESSETDTSEEDTTLVEEANCESQCAALAGCAELSTARCEAECAMADDLACGSECFDGASDCTEVLNCLGLLPPSESFREGPYGTGFRNTAGPVNIETTKGTWSFETFYDGNESYLFLNTLSGEGDFNAYVQALWSSNFKFFLWEAPTNVHIFFMTFDPNPDLVLAMEEKIEGNLSKLSPEEQCHWRKRIHFVTTPSYQIVGWIGEMLSSSGWAGFAVDRLQQIRPVGLLQTVGGTPQLSHLAYEAQFYNFEWEREQELAAEEALVLPILEATSIKNEKIDISLPSAEELSEYDTLHVDMSNFCPDHLDSNCGEWDYLSYMYICEIPAEEPNPNADTPCFQGAPANLLEEEILGQCSTGDFECTSDTSCPVGSACEGYQPAIYSEEEPPETQACSCIGIMGEDVESTQTCNAEGTGFGECSCPCSTEIGRWITTYGREGRWVSDATPFMAYFRRGGPVRIRLELGNSYVTDLSFRFTNEGTGSQAASLIPLFDGGGYNEAYNDKYEPMDVEIPADAKRVELFAFITGHGFGKDEENCAEFCNHEHYFTINGTEYTHDNPYVGDNFGCAKQIGEGTVPNQYGTWYLGRGGWCPGLDVKPFRVDVTESIAAGETANLEYKSLFQGAPYVPIPFDWASGGFGGNIRMTSYLAVYN